MQKYDIEFLNPSDVDFTTLQHLMNRGQAEKSRAMSSALRRAGAFLPGWPSRR
jgi:hypothetical protein